MITSNNKHLFIIFILLLLAILAFAVLPASSGLIISIAFLLFGLIAASLMVIKKHRASYLQGKITRSEFLRNTALDILGILIAVTLAGLLGRYLTQIVTVQISHDITRIVISILIVILIGTSIGLLVKHTWGRLIKP